MPLKTTSFSSPQKGFQEGVTSKKQLREGEKGSKKKERRTFSGLEKPGSKLLKDRHLEKGFEIRK